MTTAQILHRLRGVSALIVGDICLDRWCTYDPMLSEPSRETGLDRVAVVAVESTPGAGGTVANNARALGVGRVAVAGIVGDDAFGWELKRELARRGIDSDALLAHPKVATFTYSKLLNLGTGAEDLPRVDFVRARPMPADAENSLIERLRELARDFDVIFVADQAETPEGGVITGAVRQELSALARRYIGKVFWADSRLRAELFRDVTIKINQQEARAACERLGGAADYGRLKDHTRAPLLMVTHGPEGALVLESAAERWVRAAPIAYPLDICGAGDSFSAAAGCALAAGASPEEAAAFGNRAASITIMQRGTGTASAEEVARSETN
jgi:rfaE bifunctional protein kinase chain/domain